MTKYIQYEDTSVTLSPEGAALERVFNEVEGSRHFQEQAVVCLEFLKSKALTGELRVSGGLKEAYLNSVKALPAGDAQAILLLSRVFSMVPMTAADKPLAGSADYDLMGFHALTETLWGNMRELYENMFLALAMAKCLKLPAFEATKDLPFAKAVPSIALGCAAKNVLVTGRLPAPELKGDLAAGLGLWRTVRGIALNLKDAVDPKTLEIVEAADKLVSEKFHAAGII